MALLSQMYATSVNARIMFLYGVLEISWRNPDHPEFKEVAVYRKLNDFATSELDPYATLVYKGTAEKIYDYRLDGLATTTFKDAAEKSIGTYNPYNQTFTGKTQRPLDADTMYYYTVFTIDKAGNYYSTDGTTATGKPNKDHGLSNVMYQNIPGFYRIEDRKKQLQRYFKTTAMAYDYLLTSINHLQDFVSVDRCHPWQLDYLAYLIDWEIDKTLPVPSQRQTLKNAINIYRNAGTKKGLDTLVKIYSGFPNSSGVLESRDSSVSTVYFGYFPEDQLRYDYEATPNLATLNSALIGKPGDPLKYVFDGSPNSKVASERFVAYVNKTTAITPEQEETMRNRLDRLLTRFAPAGTKFDIEIY